MIKWMAFVLALIALCSAADEGKVKATFDKVEARLDAIESRKCMLMAVTTPQGTATICANQ